MLVAWRDDGFWTLTWLRCWYHLRHGRTQSLPGAGFVGSESPSFRGTGAKYARLKSTTRCPSLAVDLSVGGVPNLPHDSAFEWLGARWKMMGGRWGGDFSPGKDIYGVNRAEQNHFDLGVGV